MIPPGADSVFCLAPVLERHVTLAQEEEQQTELQSMWEMADVLDFLRVFCKDIPGIANLEWTANGLESALITSTGGPGLLATIHMVGACWRGDVIVYAVLVDA